MQIVMAHTFFNSKNLMYHKESIMAKAASKSTKKASATTPKPPKPPYGPHPLYAVPIKEAAASGNLKDMKSMAAKARKHVSDVNAALAKLDQAITKAGG